jgi:hypothetical protein
VQIKLTNHLTGAVPILHTRAPVSAPALAPAIVGAFYLRKISSSFAILTAILRPVQGLRSSSGSLAIFAAIRRAFIIIGAGVR